MTDLLAEHRLESVVVAGGRNGDVPAHHAGQIGLQLPLHRGRSRL
jgi:hypothetical protein